MKTSLIGLRTFERGREHLEDYRKEAEDSHVVIDVFDDIENLDSTAREGTPPLDLLNSNTVKASIHKHVDNFFYLTKVWDLG